MTLDFSQHVFHRKSVASQVQQWLGGLEGAWLWFVTFVASIAEYIVPPLPGDVAVLLASVQAHVTNSPWWFVYSAATLGSVVGGVVAYTAGRWLALHRGRWPAWLLSPQATRAFDRLQRGYTLHGAAYLIVNRFVPGLRAFFFVGAGVFGMRPAQVVLYGMLSAAVWNAGLVALAWSIGANLPKLFEAVSRHGAVAALVAMAVLGLLWWRSRERT